jgi:predicted enzyme related to lactoylglutathione lyase
MARAAGLLAGHYGRRRRAWINGGILRRQHPGAGTCNTVSVGSVDDAVATITKNGGKVALAKMAVPGVGYLAYCTDTEGNVFGVLQPDANAK